MAELAPSGKKPIRRYPGNGQGNEQPVTQDEMEALIRCLIPGFDGASLSSES